ncbi:hypothetical protein BDV96DRAFT_225581 [Lophiotrema nucula]|uniref:Uncharacterized protein n=1 Tax=Lophiotrema nucula TaxID=690887 RepID=A0A6A5YUL4_9PLEO|nr:hypothetical protein BDV96DRAFT_225581 [Lophiotrema nucula]
MPFPSYTLTRPHVVSAVHKRITSPSYQIIQTSCHDQNSPVVHILCTIFWVTNQEMGIRIYHCLEISERSIGVSRRFDFWFCLRFIEWGCALNCHSPCIPLGVGSRLRPFMPIPHVSFESVTLVISPFSLLAREKVWLPAPVYTRSCYNHSKLFGGYTFGALYVIVSP